MKKLLILTSNKTQFDSILDTCNGWKEEFTVIPVRNENEAITNALKESIDLILCDVTERSPAEIAKLFKFTYSVPFIPCIAIINEQIHKTEDLMRLGVSSCLNATYSSLELYRWVTELLEVSTSSVIKGIPIHSLLQMLESEAKTCTLRIKNDHDIGLIFFEDGKVVAAEYGALTKEDAVHSIIVLENSTVEIRYYNRLRKREINQNTVSLIMEALRLQDERKELQESQEKKNKTRLDLKQFSPASHTIEADIGTKLKLDFDGSDISLMSSLVGIIPNKYIIITMPTTCEHTLKILRNKSEVLVRYMNIGRLCLFKTQIQHKITEPSDLLFLEFPSVIFYHELRKEKRTKLFLPTVLQTNDDTEFHCLVTDLSIMGCLCEIKAKRNAPFPVMNIGDLVSLNCLLPGIDENEFVKGIVRNLKETREEMRLGIQFDKPEERIKKSIYNYLTMLEQVA